MNRAIMPHIRQKVTRLCLLLALGSATAVPAAVLNFQGRVMQGNTPFNGQGRFHFSLVDAQGSVVWTTGSPQLPTSPPTPLIVNQGRFSVALGDPAVGQKPIDESLAGQPLTLRVWFDDQAHGWSRLGDDLAVALPRSAAPMTVAQGDAILKELREIRTLLARQPQPAAEQGKPAAPQTPATPPAPQYVTVPLGKSPEIGAESAPWVLMEFTDFQCPFCRRFSDEILPEIRKQLIDTGKVRFIARELPLKFHPFALPAAKVATAAHQQGKYWDLRGPLFAKNSTLSEQVIIDIANGIGIDGKAALTSTEAQQMIDEDTAAAQAAGITGTPSFVFGKIKDGRLNGLKLVGASNAQVFLSQLDKEMNAKPAKTGGAE